MSNVRLSEPHLQHYHNNLNALHDADPELFARLEALAIPDTVEAAAGRDGSATLRLCRHDGTWQWFGGSSMPSVSTPALLGGFACPGRNVFLPGVGTGWEAPAVAERLPPFCAVLAWDPDPLAVKLALHVRDCSFFITDGRLILLTGEDLVEAVVRLFEQRPGLEFPQRVLPLPTSSAAQQERTRVQLEAAGRRVVQRQAQAVAAITGNLKAPTDVALGNAPRLAIVSRDPRDETIDLARRLVSAAAELGWPTACSVPDRPDACHALARLKAIERHRPDMVLLLNCLKGPLARLLPGAWPTASWLITADSIGTQTGASLADEGLIFASRPDMVRSLVKAGAAADRAHLLERATDPATHSPDRAGPDVQRAVGGRVVVVAEGHSLDAAAANITLASHVALWKALCKRTEPVVGQWRDGLAEQVLSRAERDCGIRLTDQDLRGRFLSLIRLRLVPVLIARSMIGQCAGAGVDVAVWGTGWNTHPTVKRLICGGGSDAPARRAIYQTAAVVVCPWYCDEAIQTVLDCLAAGGLPIFHKPEGRLDKLHPQLNEVLSRVPSAASVEALVGQACRLAASPEARQSAAAEARQVVLSRHTLIHRLNTIRRTVLAFANAIAASGR